MSGYYKGKYDPAEFNVPPSLQKGTSQKVQCYIQSAHARALDILAHCGHFPWGKDTDVVRWCIQHGLRYIDQIDPGVITSVMRQANIINAILDEETRNLKFIENFDKLQTNVMQLRGIGEEDMAKDLVMRVYREICIMPDEPDREARWKMKYLAKFEGMFKDMIDFNER